MRLIIQKDYEAMSRWTAAYMARKIIDQGKLSTDPFVLGLPTGSTPVGTYQELVRLHKEGKLSFANVITFNMDEYVGLPKNHPESYYSFMHRHLFDHLDIPSENVNILDGNAKDLALECAEYEDRIAHAGGVKLFLGGVGPDGHIAFNEPGSSLESRTRIKTLTWDTILANSRFFGNDPDKVPRLALTVGVGTVMNAEEVVLCISGHGKARALKMIIEEGVNHMWTASILQLHPHAIVICDEEATVELRVGTVNYFKDIEKNNLTPVSV